jgi:hypothetical protein
MSMSKVLLLGLCVFLIHCGGTVNESSVFNVLDVVTPDATVDPSQIKLQGQGVDESCVKDQAGFSDCRPFLKCIDNVCRATGDIQENYYCILDDECAPGLHCSIAAKCSPVGEGQEFETCITAGDCEEGFFCKILGLGGYCSPVGDGDIGALCSDKGDCLGGLRCGALGECSAGKLGIDINLWEGRSCQDDDLGPGRVYFEIPPISSGEFFRLPWPNDIRTVNGKVDLTDFPTPGLGLLDVDFPKRLIDAVQAGQSGYSNVPAIYFRFSTGIDMGSIKTGGDAPNVQLVDIEPSSTSYGEFHGYSWYATAGSTNRYICDHWLTLQSSWKQPLKPATRYAAILRRGIRVSPKVEGEVAELLVADEHLKVLLADEAPTEPFFQESWERYQVLRDYLDDKDMKKDEVIGVALFTTQDTGKVHRAIREAIDAWTPQAPEAIALCDGANVSPCDDGLSGESHERGCFEVHPDAWEIHMKVPLPLVQSGVRPYLTPELGGGVVLNSEGKLEIKEEEAVCVSLTIPKKTTPSPYGYPLVIAGHGTRGTYRSSVDKFSLPVANMNANGTSVGAAVLSWDGPMHGPRRGSLISPELLYFNVGNPKAALGNSYQGFADILALVKFVKSIDWDATLSPTGKDVSFDPTRMAYMGHSQGAGYGVPAVAYSPDLQLGIWSGAGAGLMLSLLHKTSPADTKEGFGVALGEINESGKATTSNHHPVLTILQGYFDPIDTLHVARDHIMWAGEVKKAKHIFLSYGLGDTFTPPQAIETLAHVFGVRQLPGSDYTFGLKEVELPAGGNFYDGDITGVASVVKPTNYDGHFVLFLHPTQLERMQQVLGTWILDGVPTIN